MRSVFHWLSLDFRWIVIGLSLDVHVMSVGLSFHVRGLLRWMFIGISLAPMDPPWISIGFSLGSRLVFIGFSLGSHLTFVPLDVHWILVGPQSSHRWLSLIERSHQ